MRTTSPWDVWNAFLHEKTTLMCKSQHFNPIGITCSKPIPIYINNTLSGQLELFYICTHLKHRYITMQRLVYVGTSKGTSTY